MIRAQNISKDFNGIPAVRDVSFTVDEGQTLVLLGTSGCGKTTTLKMLNRLIEPSSGSISINGQDILLQKPERLRQGIGYVSQNNGLFPHYTVAENIAVVPRLLGWNTSRIMERTTDLMDQLKLSARLYANKYPDELSGGQKQRVAIARALVSNPPLLLMDEPFGALDPITRIAVRKEFLELPELKNKTIVLVTHDVQEAFALADQVCLMNEGKIVQRGTPYQLIFEPDNDFSKTFFDHQRLQLELSALKFNANWKAFGNVTSAGHEVLSDELSFWEGLEWLSEKKSDVLYIRKNDELKAITADDINAVYRKIKIND